mmetsp:Transcript_41778/g.81655  ORF Transcript_41778/g.81655 Transcript_41778/m.81655 type:complete len:358 (+) Transcript_41778:760-1833(+)
MPSTSGLVFVQRGSLQYQTTSLPFWWSPLSTTSGPSLPLVTRLGSTLCWRGSRRRSSSRRSRHVSLSSCRGSMGWARTSFWTSSARASSASKLPIRQTTWQRSLRSTPQLFVGGRLCSWMRRMGRTFCLTSTDLRARSRQATSMSTLRTATHTLLLAMQTSFSPPTTRTLFLSSPQTGDLWRSAAAASGWVTRGTLTGCLQNWRTTGLPEPSTSTFSLETGAPTVAEAACRTTGQQLRAIQSCRGSISRCGPGICPSCVWAAVQVGIRVVSRALSLSQGSRSARIGTTTSAGSLVPHWGGSSRSLLRTLTGAVSQRAGVGGRLSILSGGDCSRATSRARNSLTMRFFEGWFGTTTTT